MGKQSRASNIELLRIFAMLGVVILHYNNTTIGKGFTYVAQGSVNHAILLGLEGLFVCAVNLFMLITGYFSINSQKRSPVKAVALLLQVIVFRVVQYLINNLHKGISLTGLLTCALPVNYFVILYIAVYLLSPYLNLLLKRLSSPQRTQLVILALCLCSFWPTLVDILQDVTGKTYMGLSTISAYGSDWGYTLVNFLLMYLLGAWLQLENITMKKRYSSSILLLCAGALAFLGTVLTPDVAWSYCSPLVILEAIFAFLLFRQMQFSSKIINFFSRGAFTCFLLHLFFLKIAKIPAAVQGSPVFMICHILITAVATYLACFVAYIIYDFASKPVLKLVDRGFKKLKLDFSVEDPGQ